MSLSTLLTMFVASAFKVDINIIHLTNTNMGDKVCRCSGLSWRDTKVLTHSWMARASGGCWGVWLRWQEHGSGGWSLAVVSGEFLQMLPALPVAGGGEHQLGVGDQWQVLPAASAVAMGDHWTPADTAGGVGGGVVSGACTYTPYVLPLTISNSSWINCWAGE